jgi:hypothetical protein
LRDDKCVYIYKLFIDNLICFIHINLGRGKQKKPKWGRLGQDGLGGVRREPKWGRVGQDGLGGVRKDNFFSIPICASLS